MATIKSRIKTLAATLLAASAMHAQTDLPPKFETKLLADIAASLRIDAPTADTLVSASCLPPGSKVTVRSNGEGTVSHLGIAMFDSIGRQGVGVYGKFAERTMLQIMLCTTEHDAALLVDKQHVRLVADGKDMSGSPQQWVKKLLKERRTLTDLSLSTSVTNFTLKWSANETARFTFAASITRETIEGTTKVEAEELIFKGLSSITRHTSSISVPAVSSLSKCADTDLMVKKGSHYMLPTMNTDTYYIIKRNMASAAFDKKYPIESLKNLLQGVVSNNRYKLALSMQMYGGKTMQTTVALRDFVSYWKKRSHEFDLYCSASEKADGGSGTAYTISVIITHRQLQYVNTVSITFREEDFGNASATLPAVFTAIIPQHNVESLLK